MGAWQESLKWLGTYTRNITVPLVFPRYFFFFPLSTLDQPNPLEYRTSVPTSVLFLQPAPVANTILITLWLAGLQLFEKGEEVLPCMDSCCFEPNRLICKSVHQSSGEGGNLGVQDAPLGCTPVGQPDRPSAQGISPKRHPELRPASSKPELVVTMGEHRTAIPRSGGREAWFTLCGVWTPSLAVRALSPPQSAVSMPQLVCPFHRVPTAIIGGIDNLPLSGRREGKSLEGGGGEDCWFLTPSQTV
jgi:hypothetical protein